MKESAEFWNICADNFLQKNQTGLSQTDVTVLFF